MVALIWVADAQSGGFPGVPPSPFAEAVGVIVGRSPARRLRRGLDGLQRERQLAAGGSVAGANNQAALKAADYLLHAKLLFSDNDPGSGGGRLTPAGHNVGQ